MRVGLVVFANKYTGAAAVAELFARALHAAGVDARLLFVAGRNLEHRLSGAPWADAGLVKERTPARIVGNLRRLRRFAATVDVVICHLPHDHFLCVAAGIHRRTILARNFRSSRHFRADPFHRLVARQVDAALLAHADMQPACDRLLQQAPRMVLPVPVEEHFMTGGDPAPWRKRLRVPSGTPVLGMVGKVAPGRGFGALLDVAARCRPPVHVLAVGHGEAQPALERRARRLGMSDRVHWVGYQEDGLPGLYAAMDVVLFAAPGSDHGHRVVSEAQACGRPVVAATSIAGVDALIENDRTGCFARARPEALAERVSNLLQRREVAEQIGRAAASEICHRRFEPIGRRLARFLTDCARSSPAV